MSSRKNGSKTDRTPDGKFARGNPGRPKRARHKTTLVIEALLDGEAEGLTRKAIELAQQGDTTALRLCLERIVPARKDALVSFDLAPMSDAQDASHAAHTVLQAVAGGYLTPSEAIKVMGVVEGYRKTLETAELERRLILLEQGLNQQREHSDASWTPG